MTKPMAKNLLQQQHQQNSTMAQGFNSSPQTMNNLDQSGYRHYGQKIMSIMDNYNKYKIASSFYQTQFANNNRSNVRMSTIAAGGASMANSGRASKSTRHNNQQLNMKRQFNRNINMESETMLLQPHMSTNFTTPGGRHSDGYNKAPVRLPGLQRSSQSYVQSQQQ